MRRLGVSCEVWEVFAGPGKKEGHTVDYDAGVDVGEGMGDGGGVGEVETKEGRRGAR